MMRNIEDFIADERYAGALTNQNATIRPFKKFPQPSQAKYDEYLAKHDFNLIDVLDSPIGVFQFRKFAQKYPNFSQIIDFLVQYERVECLEAPDMGSASVLMQIGLKLPPMYEDEVEKCKRAFRRAFGPIFVLDGEEEEDPDVHRIDTFNPQLVSPYGRTSAGFGGFRSVRKIADENARAGNDQDMVNIRPGDDWAEEEFGPGEDAEAQDFFDRLHETNVQDLQKKAELKVQCIEVFARLADILREKATDLFGIFKSNSKEFVEMVKLLWYADQPIGVDDFVLFRDLGRGAFGAVSASKTKTTGTLTAIKAMNKKLIKGKGAQRIVTVEKAILQVLGDNPSHFTIWLKYSFQDSDFFYMAIPLCTGGDLGFHLRRRQFFGERAAKFHFAEILEGLAHLHGLGIIYRDLKPENVIFDAEGHARISDMGLAVQTDGQKLTSKAGTPGYWAPEVIERRPYSYSVDFWSLGCVLYELLTGLCPFSTTNSRMERDKATLSWKIKFPRTVGRHDEPESQVPFPSGAVPVILGLLDRDRETRFGASEVRKQPWFEGFDWFALQNRQLPAPWRPKEGKVYAANLYDLDAQSKENQYRKVKLLPADEIPNFNYVSKYAHELDIVQVLETEASGRLEYDRANDTPCCFM